MSSTLNKEQIEDLIEYCGSTPTHWRSDDMQICCPIHGEVHPSMGVSESKQVVHCFSCGFKGSLAWFLFNARREEFKSFRDARKFLADRYELEYRELKTGRDIKRYEDCLVPIEEDTRHTLPLYKIAPFKSGKETYQYFYDRGFDKDDVVKFMIGRDTDSKTVTIPAFYEDGTLAGVIGRYINPHRRKNERYKVYDFPRGEILYPLNLFEPIDNTLILVEGMFDAMRLHKLGYTNALAKMGVELTPKQVDIIVSKCATLIYVGDNDIRGLEGREHDIELLKDLVTVKIVDYPDTGKDVCDWSEEEIKVMLSSAHGTINKKIRRYE